MFNDWPITTMKSSSEAKNRQSNFNILHIHKMNLLIFNAQDFQIMPKRQHFAKCCHTEFTRYKSIDI